MFGSSKYAATVDLWAVPPSAQPVPVAVEEAVRVCAAAVPPLRKRDEALCAVLYHCHSKRRQRFRGPVCACRAVCRYVGQAEAALAVCGRGKPLVVRWRSYLPAASRLLIWIIFSKNVVYSGNRNQSTALSKCAQNICFIFHEPGPFLTIFKLVRLFANFSLWLPLLFIAVLQSWRSPLSNELILSYRTPIFPFSTLRNCPGSKKM